MNPEYATTKQIEETSDKGGLEKAHPQAEADMSAWLSEGKFRLREEVLDGIDRFPEAMLMLYTGHVGKLMVAP